jgi:hypothetical protein
MFRPASSFERWLLDIVVQLAGVRVVGRQEGNGVHTVLGFIGGADNRNSPAVSGHEMACLISLPVQGAVGMRGFYLPTVLSTLSVARAASFSV